MSPVQFKELSEAIRQNETCDVHVKDKLLELLTNWNQTRGFKLEKANKEFIDVLLRLFLLQDTSVSTQINTVLSECLKLETKEWIPSTDLFGKKILKNNVFVHFCIYSPRNFGFTERRDNALFVDYT